MGNFDRLVALDFGRAREEFEKGLKLVPGNPELIRGLGYTEQALGAWDESLAQLREAARLDPRSASNLNGVASTLLQLRRPREAREVFDRVLALAPANLLAIEQVAMSYLAEGDLPGARASMAKSARTIGTSTLVAFFANYQDLVWVLDAGQLEIFWGLSPSDFDDNAAVWAFCRAQAKYLSGDSAGTREYAATANAELERQLRESPDDPQLHAIRGLALSYLGRKEEAIREGELALKLGGPSVDAVSGPYMLHQLVRTEIAAGEPERALGHLEALMSKPYYVTPAMLKIDPNFDPLRQNPRFQKLVAAAK
jgi:Flp pilus assembly protein TadD